MGTKKYYPALIAIAILIVLALGTVFINHKSLPSKLEDKNKDFNTGPTLSNNPTAMPVVNTLDAKAMGAALPANFPVDTKAKLIQSIKTVDPTAKTSTILRTTTTSKTLGEAFKVYKDYVTKNGWTIANTTDAPTLKVLSADKGGAHMDITISYDGVSQSNVIIVKFVTPQ